MKDILKELEKKKDIEKEKERSQALAYEKTGFE